MTDPTPPAGPEAEKQPEPAPAAGPAQTPVPPAAPQVSEAAPDPVVAGPAEPPPPVGVGVSAGSDVSVGGHVAGRDIVNTSTTGIGTQTIGNLRVGWSEQAVLRLVIAVGALVFVTAACFFSGGLAVGGLVYRAFVDRPLSPAPEQANTFQQRLDALDTVQSGESFTLVLDEAELNAYVHYTLGPQIGFAPDTGEARLINDNGTNMIAVRGDYAPLGNLPVVATFTLTDTPGAPLQLTGVAARLFGSRDGGLGWVWVPAGWLRTVEVQVNALLGNVRLEQAVVPPGSPDGAPWEVIGEAR